MSKNIRVNTYFEMNKQFGIVNWELPRILPANCNITKINRLHYAIGRVIDDIMELERRRKLKEKKERKKNHGNSD